MAEATNGVATAEVVTLAGDCTLVSWNLLRLKYLCIITVEENHNGVANNVMQPRICCLSKNARPVRASEEIHALLDS